MGLDRVCRGAQRLFLRRERMWFGQQDRSTHANAGHSLVKWLVGVLSLGGRHCERYKVFYSQCFLTKGAWIMVFVPQVYCVDD